MIRPVLAEISGSWPSAFSLEQTSAVRRSCQTMARCTAWPVARSHTTVVSRWLVMPIAAISLAFRPAFSSASRQTMMVEVQMSSGSWPGRHGILRRRRRDAAVDDDGLAGHEGRGVGGEIGDRAGDFVGLTDPAQRRRGGAALQEIFVFPQCAGEIGFHQARRHAID